MERRQSKRGPHLQPDARGSAATFAFLGGADYVCFGGPEALGWGRAGKRLPSSLRARLSSSNQKPGDGLLTAVNETPDPSEKDGRPT